MSAKFDIQGDVINHTPSGAISSGEVFAIGDLIVVALEDIAASALGTVRTSGVFELDLASGKTFSAGDAVYVSSSEATDSGTYFGYAVADSDATNDIVKAMLIQAIPDDAS